MSPSRQQRADELGRLLEGRRRRKARIRRRRRRVLIAIVTLAILIPVGVTVAGFATAEAFLSSCNLDTLKPIKIGQTSFIYAADGSLLGSIPAERHRQPVALRDVSFWMKKATVAVEDRRFYSNRGVDYEGIARAFWRDITAQKVVQGGSTLTQQLVRNLYPIAGGRTLGRKVKEACLAIKLAQKRSKDQILESWLNNVYFGSSAYGIEAASQIYFSKPAKDLSLKEARAARRPAAGAVALRPAARPEGGDRAPRRRAAKAMLDTGAINDYQYRTVIRDRSPHLHPGQPLLDDPRGLLLQLRDRPARRRLRREHRARGRAAGLHDDRPAPPARRRARDPEHAERADRPGLGARRHRSAQRRRSGR